MDVITLGDFSITNHKGITCMSFRIPSSHEIDYVKNLNYGITPIRSFRPGKLGSNFTPPKKRESKSFEHYLLLDSCELVLKVLTR